jgi:cold-inducible RNA-binding protein
MKNLYVGNVSFRTTEEDLRAAFEPFGAIERVSVVTDRFSGSPRGFAFVEMTNDAEAEKAIEALNGKEYDGRAWTVNEARPKAERGGFGGGGGGGRGGQGRGNNNYGGGGRRDSGRGGYRGR